MSLNAIALVAATQLAGATWYLPPGALDPASAVHHNDDVAASFGNTAAAPDAKLLWDTSGTHQLRIWLTDVDGGGTDGVPIYWLTGDITTYLGGDLDLASATSIVENSGGLLMLGGSMSSSRGLGAGHLGIAVDTEIDGIVYLEGFMYVYSGIYMRDNKALYLGSSGDALFLWDTYQTEDAATLGLDNASKLLLVIPKADYGTNYGHPKYNDPAIGVQSEDETDPGLYSLLQARSIKLGGGGLGHGCVNETFAYSDMVDGGGASGTFDMTEQIPDGAVVIACALHSLTGFTGDVSAVVTFGDGTDADRYNTGTPSVFTTNASGVALGDPSGTKWHDDAATVTVTITSNADFTSVSAGQATVGCCYLTP